MRVSKDTEVFVRGVGYVKVSKIFEMLKDGNEVTVRSSYGEWTNIIDAWESSNRAGIHLITKDGVDYVIGDTSNVLSVAQRYYCLDSKKACDLNKNSVVVHNYTVVDEELGIRYRDEDLYKLALILKYCTSRDSKYHTKYYTFTSADKSKVDECHNVFLNEKDRSNICITKDVKHDSISYKFTVSNKKAVLIKEILRLFIFDLSNKNIPNTIFCSDEYSRKTFFKYLKPFHFGEYARSATNKTKYLTGSVCSVDKHELESLKRFMHTLGINSRINFRGYLYACILGTQDSIRVKDFDFKAPIEFPRGYIYSANIWGVSGLGKDCPANNKDTFILYGRKNNINYKFLKEFYTYHQPLKITSVEEVFCDMIELEVEDYVDIGGIFVK